VFRQVIFKYNSVIGGGFFKNQTIFEKTTSDCSGGRDMHMTNLRKVGGSVMVAVPPIFLDQLHLQVGATVGMLVADGRIVIEAKPRPRYSLDELLAASDYSQAQGAEDREWVDAPAAGYELI